MDDQGVEPALPDHLRYLADQHPSRHGESGAGGEVWRDHDPQAGLGEGQLVGVEDEELVHHDGGRRFLAVGLTWQKVKSECEAFFFRRFKKFESLGI